LYGLTLWNPPNDGFYQSSRATLWSRDVPPNETPRGPAQTIERIGQSFGFCGGCETECTVTELGAILEAIHYRRGAFVQIGQQVVFRASGCARPGS
jgi:hypothetical protein